MTFYLEANSNDDTISVNDIAERITSLREERDDYAAAMGGPPAAATYAWELVNPDEAKELRILGEFMDELSGCGRNFKFEGDWYPDTLINVKYFTRYAQEFAEDVGAISSDVIWPCRCIDWEEAAAELAQDYTEVELKDLDGNSSIYYYRG